MAFQRGRGTIGFGHKNKLLNNCNLFQFADNKFAVPDAISDNTAVRMTMDSISLENDTHVLPWISMTYSKEKLLFIVLAQEFCKKTTPTDFMFDVKENDQLPAILRIENIVSNSKSFKTTFDCPTGSAMDFYSQLKNQFPYLDLNEDQSETEPSFATS